MVAGILNGSFATPMKYARQWKWENIWSVWAVVGMFLFPWLMVWLTVPHALAVYREAGIQPLLLVVGCGVGVGLAQIFFGLGIAALGIALNFAIAIGLSTVLGSIVPLVAKHREMILTTKGMVILAGVALVLVGIVFCAVAGKLKEKNMQSSAGEPQEGSAKRVSFKTGLILCVLAGIGSPFQNFGLVYGDKLMACAAEMGVALSNRTNVIWAPMLTAALLPYLIYCVYRLKKNKSARLYLQSGNCALLGFRRNHGRALVWKHNPLRRGDFPDGELGSHPGLASVYVGHHHCLEYLGICYGRMEECRREGAGKDADGDSVPCLGIRHFGDQRAPRLGNGFRRPAEGCFCDSRLLKLGMRPGERTLPGPLWSVLLYGPGLLFTGPSSPTLRPPSLLPQDPF